MNTFSEEHIRRNCPHCDPHSFALKHVLKETNKFWIVCDVHPLTYGHILIIPKKHIVCIGDYPDDVFEEFLKLYAKCFEYIKKSYGAVSSFEHGKIGQTVFHSHVQMFPFAGLPNQIIPEGEKYISSFGNFEFLKTVYQKDGQYLFFSIGERKWIVDSALGASRFFRDRFAKALGHPQRGNWREMRKNDAIMQVAGKEINDLENKWKNSHHTREVQQNLTDKN